MTRPQLARTIFDIAHLTGTFLLRSGMTSNEYFDKYLFESRPDVLRAIAQHLHALIPSGVEVLAGLEMGGIPIVTALSLESGFPAAFVRKKAKDYGTRKCSEGAQVYGKKTLIIEDVITSGGQVILSAQDLKNAGADIVGVLCVIDREQGGREKLAKSGLELHALFTMTELKSPVLE
ncbi:MAG: orotate phosphoribosyltransferase [Candidatus Kapaibacterium sp.]|nr:MAG: orotate phosphoribosyltransferase [Candidatus Kapabacteria bacterium]